MYVTIVEPFLIPFVIVTVSVSVAPLSSSTTLPESSSSALVSSSTISSSSLPSFVMAIVLCFWEL